jgi:hypothetical protein
VLVSGESPEIVVKRVDRESDEGIAGDEHAVVSSEERDVTRRVTGCMHPSPARQVRNLTIEPEHLDDWSPADPFEDGIAAAAEGTDGLFNVITEREERASIAMASNLPISEWGSAFPDGRPAAAVVDRWTYRAHVLETGTGSCRLRASQRTSEPGREAPGGPDHTDSNRHQTGRGWCRLGSVGKGSGFDRC